MKKSPYYNIAASLVAKNAQEHAKTSPYDALVGKSSSKYQAVKTGVYSSKKEAKRASELNLMQKAGKISDLREQVVFELAPSVIRKCRKRPPVKYVADFVYTSNGAQVVEDVKGFRTPIYNLKAHLMKSVHGIEILET